MKNEHFGNCPGGDCSCEERRYWRVLWLSVGIAVLEIAGGWYSHSLALLSDGFHVGVDMLAAGTTIVVTRLVRRQPCDEQQLRRRGGYVHVWLLVLVVLAIAVEAVQRLFTPREVASGVMLAVAIAGTIGNGLQLLILRSASVHHVTQEGMRQHVLTDLRQSLLVIAGGLVIAVSGYRLIDPVLSLGIAYWIAEGAWGLWQRVRLPEYTDPTYRFHQD